MKTFKHNLYILLICSLVALLTSCSEKAPEKLGDTSFSITLPKGYKQTKDKTMEEDQIAYYFKDDNSIDFDVYAWDKADYNLKDEAAYFASEYNSTAKEIEINGNKGYFYISLEEFDGETWTVYNYMFEDDKYILELCFWTDNSQKEQSDVKNILNTLSKK